MCTSIIEIARAEGMAKRGDEWFPLSQAVVAYDHARHAPLGDVITLDFINANLDPGARAGIELTLETAKELRAALDRAIAAAEFEEAGSAGQGRRAQARPGGLTRASDVLEFLPARSAGRCRGTRDGGVMGYSIGAAHDPSVAVRRRHLPALRAGRKLISCDGGNNRNGIHGTGERDQLASGGSSRLARTAPRGRARA